MKQFKRHVIQNQRKEAFIAIILLLVSLFLLYDAYKARGKDTPFPFGVVTPW